MQRVNDFVSRFNDLWNLSVKSSLIGCWDRLPFLNSLLPEAKQPQNFLSYCACSADFEVWEIFAVEYSFIYYFQYSLSSTKK
jgi:hypothetical protein